jgi:hypothetical protein
MSDNEINFENILRILSYSITDTIKSTPLMNVGESIDKFD